MNRLFGSKTSSRSGREKRNKVSVQPYYHYYLPRVEVENVLHVPGDFLVRESIMPDKRASIVLSIRVDQPLKVKHIPVEFFVEDGVFRFDPKVGKSSIPELIEYHRKKAVPIQGAVIKNPIPRNKWEILEEQIKFDNILLGQGNFATVHKGQLLVNGSWVPIAYKRIRAEKLPSKIERDNAKDQILREFQIGRKLQSDPPNTRILVVHGIYIGSEACAMIMEFCDGGALDSYMKRMKGRIPIYAKLNFLLHAADGLSHLHSRNLIHRDVAARNFLMIKREQYLPLVKVADFGLTREGPSYKMVANQHIPYVISAIECLVEKDPVWTYKSDCWSFGVLMYDIFNECQFEPYHDLIPHNKAGIRDMLHSGFRLPAHESMSEDCRQIMDRCFIEEPNNRPDMNEIQQLIRPLVRKFFDEKR